MPYGGFFLPPSSLHFIILASALCYGLVMAKGLKDSKVAPAALIGAAVAPDGAGARGKSLHSFLFSRGIGGVPSYAMNGRLRSETPDPGTLDAAYYQTRQVANSLAAIEEGGHMADEDDDDGRRPIHFSDDDEPPATLMQGDSFPQIQAAIDLQAPQPAGPEGSESALSLQDRGPGGNGAAV